jgi:hypothetical protein
MAKRRKSTATKTRTVTRTVAAKAPIIKVTAPSGMQRIRSARKHAGKARKHVIAGGKKFMGIAQNQLVAIAGAAGLAFIQKQGVKIPKPIASLSVPVNAGILAWGAARLLKSQMLDHVATGMLCAGAYAFAAGSPIQGDVMGNGRAVVFGDDLEGDDLEGDDD